MSTRSIYGGDPFQEMQRLQSEMNRLFQTTLPTDVGSFPPINVYASRDGVAVTAELPGVSEDDLEISVYRDTLTLAGVRKDPERSEAKGYHRRERGSGRFTRTVSLPFQVDVEKVDARLENGVLRLSLQRPESDKPKRIQLRRT
jgi:HSP20 family protein